MLYKHQPGRELTLPIKQALLYNKQCLYIVSMILHSLYYVTVARLYIRHGVGYLCVKVFHLTACRLGRLLLIWCQGKALDKTGKMWYMIVSP